MAVPHIWGHPGRLGVANGDNKLCMQPQWRDWKQSA